MAEFEIWFLTGSQDLHGEETLRQVAENSARIAEALGASDLVPVRVVWKPVVKNPEAILATCIGASPTDRCVGVITWMHTFSPEKMWIAGLQALTKPLLHLHTQFNRDLPWTEIDMDFMNLNQAAHGDRQFSHIEARLGLRRKTVAGHWAEPGVQQRIATWARAACGLWEAKHLRLARFGDNMWNVAVTARQVRPIRTAHRRLGRVAGGREADLAARATLEGPVCQRRASRQDNCRYPRETADARGDGSKRARCAHGACRQQTFAEVPPPGDGAVWPRGLARPYDGCLPAGRTSVPIGIGTIRL